MADDLIQIIEDRIKNLVKEYGNYVDEQGKIIGNTEEDNENFGYYNGLCEGIETEIMFLGFLLEKLGVKYDD